MVSVFFVLLEALGHLETVYQGLIELIFSLKIDLCNLVVAACVSFSCHECLSLGVELGILFPDVSIALFSGLLGVLLFLSGTRCIEEEEVEDCPEKHHTDEEEQREHVVGLDLDACDVLRGDELGKGRETGTNSDREGG